MSADLQVIVQSVELAFGMCRHFEAEFEQNHLKNKIRSIWVPQVMTAETQDQAPHGTPCAVESLLLLLSQLLPPAGALSLIDSFK